MEHDKAKQQGFYEMQRSADLRLAFVLALLLGAGWLFKHYFM